MSDLADRALDGQRDAPPSVREVFPVTLVHGGKSDPEPMVVIRGNTMNPDGTRAGSHLDDIREPSPAELTALEQQGDSAFIPQAATPTASGVSAEGNSQGAPSKA